MERNEINDGKPLVNDYSASSVEEYLEVMMFLSRRIRGEQGALPRLWYRGQQRNSNLNPSLFRDARTRLNEQGYSKNHLREDYRYQFFRARCNQLVTSSPDSKIEWTELMQHHLVHTRLMDWSESAVTALLFAVEPFLNPNGKNHDILYRRSTITPVVWILDPVTLNDYVYAEFLKRPDFLRDALPDVTPFHMTDEQRERIADEIFRRLEKKKDAYFMKETDCAIISLSVIESDRHAASGRLLQLLENDQFNPFFYLLLRYYNDGLPVPVETLPPLAVVHPYHSERIQVQRGVFTVTPHYRQEVKGVDRRPMNLHPAARKCLYKIRVTRPARVAEELLEMGERMTSLYPELAIYSEDIEAETYMF